MIVTDDDARRPESRGFRTGPGWTSLHSWIFLGIVAVGLLVIGAQNRYHYLNPQGLGKAYRIDKLFGSIQEFEPGRGWIAAQLQSAPVGQGMSMMEPPMPGSQAMPMHMPGQLPASVEMPRPGSAVAVVPKEEAPAARSRAGAQPKEAQEMSKEDRIKAFKKAFPDFGPDEFQLANDDLYPDWKRSIAPKGTWPEFLGVYGDFIQWWSDSGSPPEPGAKLWEKYKAAAGKK